MKVKLLLLTLFMSVFSWGQAIENFTNIPTTSSTNYLSRTWTGTDGVTWNATAARTDQTLTGKAICTNATGSVTSPSYSGGMGVLTFNYVRAFTGTGTRSIQVWVNGSQIGSTITVSGSSDVVANYSQPINIGGNVVLELRTSGNQIKIDDISWTSYIPCTPPSDPTGSITVSANPSCGAATLSYPAGYYWQTTATGTSTLLPTSSNYSLASNGTVYVRAYDGVSCWSTNALSSGAVVINSPSTISVHPSNVTVGIGANTSFSVTAANVTTYQWQVDTGSGFTNLSNVAPYSNVTTATLNITGVTFLLNSYQYRCVLSNAPCTDVNSNTATLTVTPPSPEINLVGNGNTIIDGDAIPTTTDFTDFGNVVISTNLTRTFTIQNTGTAALNLSGVSPYVTISGADAASFSVTTVPSNSIAAASSTIFIITFTPTSLGLKTATITINNDDSSEAVYDFAIQGTCVRSTASDVIAAGGESTTVSSLENDAAITTTADGTQVWQFTIRDGGATVDADNLPTIVNGITFSQAGGNQINDWADAIQAVALFNGTIKIADGVVITNQIQFTGAPIISVPDGGSVTLSVRLSVQLNPNNSGSNIDGDDFVFTISNGNVTTNASGSGFTTFTATNSTNSQNVLSVIATQLVFSQQPSSTGVSNPMANVTVSATDTNGNVDVDFSSSVSLTSSGTMTGSPLTSVATSGIATFTAISHTVIGAGLNLTATSGAFSVLSSLFDITEITVLLPGDLAIIAVNTSIGGSGLDQIAFVSFKDITPGTAIYLTDNGYERINVGQWGGTEGVISITRTGSTIPKGTIMVLESTTANVTSASHFDVWSCGSIDTNWTKTALSGGSIGGFNLNSNDDVYIMQGGVWTNNTSHTSTYTGNVLYAWTESGWSSGPSLGTCNSTSGDVNNCTAWSTLYPGLECFNTLAPVGAGKVKFDDPIDPDFSTTTNGRFDWIALINNSANWDSYADNTLYDAGGYNYKAGCATLTIDTDIYVNGKWSGRADTNWFNCSNWDTLVVPDSTVNVQVEDNIFNNQAIVDSTAPFASYYGNVAKANNITITGEKVEIATGISNILEVHGNLSISGTGSLDMDDSNTSTADGVLKLYGNWTNSLTNAAFEEGNGTVQFLGASPQIINAVTPLGTESFYNVVLDNNFDTAISNDLIATGDLTISSGKSVSIDTNGYIYAYNKLSNNGTFNIENNGQLIQVNETDTNDGVYTGTNFGVKRIAFVNKDDYVYWASPVNGFDVSNILFGPRYVWNTVFPNSNGTFGNWVTASGAMEKGKGYIVKVPDSSPVRPAIPAQQLTHFYGKPNNGQFTFGIDRYTNVTSIDDNWNLIGNPYPSAIFAEEFLEANDTKIAGSVWVWKHGQSPTNAVDPFYYDFSGNYYSNDYLKYNKLGASDTTFNGIIASGQGFLVNMLESASIPGNTVVFNNAMRTVVNPDFTLSTYDNSIFYKNSNSNKSVSSLEEKHRIWLDIINVSNNQTDTNLLGYSTNSTLAVDHFYDCVFVPRTEVAMYSLIGTGEYIIQGRPLPFIDSDLVPMGVKIVDAGNHTIAIKKIDGLFEGSQDIYLEDKLLNIIHDLKAAPYNFTSEVGVFNDRFVIRYTATALSNDDFNSINSSVIVASQDSEIAIKSGAGLISSVSVYDVLGREIVKKNDINNSEITLSNVLAKNQALIVQITLENGQIVTRKIIL